MRSLVLGDGQIGQAVSEIISAKDTVYIFDKKGGEPPLLTDIDIMHICFPCPDVERFLGSVKGYIRKYQPKHVIIWSTVPIGVTRQIQGAVHSPVEGRHPELAPSIRSMVRWIGASNSDEGEFYREYFNKLYIRVRVVLNSDFTEFLKLRSTSKFGINLVWADYEARVAKDLGMDFELLKDFDRDYNKLYHNIGMEWAQRYILDPPNGYIGGHCVVPNAELLDEQYPDELLKIIKEYK